MISLGRIRTVNNLASCASSPNFKRLDRLATELLLKQKDFISLKIDVRQLDYDYPIHFDSIQHYCEVTKRSENEVELECLNNGYTLILTEGYLLLYNELHSPKRINWTLAHEIGHIYAGHLYDGDIEEIEAHFFAAQLLMPEAILRKLKQDLGFLDFAWIYNNFNVSMDASVKRVKTLNSKGYAKDRWATLLLSKFSDARKELLNRLLSSPANFHKDMERTHEIYNQMQEYCIESRALKSCDR